MMRLFVDLSLTVQTGAGSALYAWEICHRLMRLGHAQQVLPMTCPFRTLGRVGIPRKMQALLRDLLWRPFLSGLEAQEQDCFLFINAFVPRRFLNRKYAVVVLDLGAWHDRSILSWRGRLGTRTMPRVLTGAQHVFAISDSTADDLVREFNIPRKDIVLAPCGLSDAYARPCSGHAAVVNGISLPECYVLHVGSFEPKKNIKFLLDVFQEMRSQATRTENSRAGNCKLLLTGAESWRDQGLREALAAHPLTRDIIILGRVEAADLPGLYGQASALVFPSALEGFGLPVIEALSQGTPVLVQRNSSLTQFGRFGATVFDAFDTPLWASRLLDIISQRQRLPDTHIQAVRATFSWDRTARTILETMLPCASA
ncbi:MAG TPA: glycosyltransferase family 1 protein [Desulfonatronum sp.]|nr:glycosyltransferase family 1 protein [Desulfonatronum sp.]